MFSKFIWVTLIQKQQKYILKKGDFEYWAWAPHFVMIWNITVDTSSEVLIFSRMSNMQVFCPYYVKKPHESNNALTDVWLYLWKFELNELIIKPID